MRYLNRDAPGHAGKQYVIKLIESIRNESNEQCLIIEYAPGGDLLSLVEKTPSGMGEDVCLPLFKQLALGLSFIHQQSVAHLDISPENCLLSIDGTMKICDFGLALPLNDGNAMSEPRGKLMYIAPELLEPSAQDMPYDIRKADVYSLGVTLAVMLLGFQPYSKPDRKGDSAFKVLMERGFGTLLLCYRKQDHISPVVVELLESMLSPQALNRPLIDEVLDHPALALIS